ncbi:membrane protein insertion efficiency factor YidD [Rhodanobacter ginsengiterrae]|uniref:membrane protein insertion efficiency factor YidD n=1 Tax=Rhodanobacter ginsengiterrae TaxID=2008451 RepID=UPI003CFB551C
MATTFFATGALAGPAFFAGDLAADLLATGLGATFFAAGLLAGLPAALGLALATVFGAALADVLLAFFTVAPLPATVVDLPALLPDEALPFCALAAVELRVVFAISLHRLWPWRPGVIAHACCTSKPVSGILVPLPDASRCSTVNIPTRFILWLLRLYKRWLSPLLGPHCRFHPSCSDYARIAVTRFGPWRGSLLTGWRLLRCQPLCEGGEDPVPDHFRYPRCRCKQDTHGHDLH